MPIFDIKKRGGKYCWEISHHSLASYVSIRILVRCSLILVSMLSIFNDIILVNGEVQFSALDERNVTCYLRFTMQDVLVC